MNLVSAIMFPVRAGLEVTDAALGVAETALATTRMALSSTTVTSVGAATLTNSRGPLQLVYQVAALASDDRPLGQALQPGVPLDRPLAPCCVVDRITSDGGTLERLFEP